MTFDQETETGFIEIKFFLDWIFGFSDFSNVIYLHGLKGLRPVSLKVISRVERCAVPRVRQVLSVTFFRNMVSFLASMFFLAPAASSKSHIKSHKQQQNVIVLHSIVWQNIQSESNL